MPDSGAAPANAQAKPVAATNPPAPAPASKAAKTSTAQTAAKPQGNAAVVVSSGTCQASFYDESQQTASGETFDPSALTAANKTLPFNTMVRVTNVANGKSVVVRINDRGPYSAGRCLDLSSAAFASIASLSAGVANVKYDVLGQDAA